ncbi:MAG: PEP-CTERM sorting domain-containing protein [Acidobacteria bacterium]|nr:PEP-CTERM sorting domain-containing protein [Acidobacteriota bacterium]
MRLLTVLLLVGIALPMYGGPIVDLGLFGTGVDGAGAVLPGGSSDTHWNLSIQGGGAAAAQVTSDAAKPGLWIANDSLSKWISFTGAGNPNAVETVGADWMYSYTQTFSLTNFYLNSNLAISGQYAMDNYGAVYLNGNLVQTLADTIPSVFTNFSALHSFSITGPTNFVAGTNTLQFVVYNRNMGTTPNATGLRLQIDSAKGELIPEPGTLVLLGGGLLALGFYRRRR